MSFSETHLGKPPGVYAKLASNPNIPDSLKRFVEDVLANYPSDCQIFLDVSGHINTQPSNAPAGASLVYYGGIKLDIRMMPEAVAPIPTARSAD